MTHSSPVAVVTGAAEGIGRRVAETLADRGYALALIDARGVNGTLDVVRHRGVEVFGLSGEVSSEADVRTLADLVLGRWGRVDALVNYAGARATSPAESTSLDQWLRLLDANLTAPFLLAQEFGRSMLAAHAGSIINIVSVGGALGMSDRSTANACEQGLLGLTRALAVEWGGRGVRVNAVCPGKVLADQFDDELDAVLHVPMGRFATTTDVAEAVAFLADPCRSGFVNGVALPVDGGWAADNSWTTLRMR